MIKIGSLSARAAIRQSARLFVHKRSIAPASAGTRVLAQPRQLISITPTPSPDRPISDLVTHYSGAEYPQVPIWSLVDLEPSPPRQKLLRRHLETQHVDDLQFLRWRNALLPCADFANAIGHLSYALLPALSVFDRHGNGGTGAESWDLIAPLRDEICGKTAHKTPFWVVERLSALKLSSPKHISVAVDLIRQYPANQNRRAFTDIILFCISHHLHSIIPGLLKALREDHGVGSETFAVILRALVSGPLVPMSIPAFPHRSVRKRVSCPKRPKPGPQTSLITFTTHNEMCLILCHMIAKGMKLDEATYKRLANARPALPSFLMRTLNVDSATDLLPAERKLSAMARSLANEGRSLDAGRILDRVRKRRTMHSAPVVPVSAAFDKRLSSDHIGQRLPHDIDYARLDRPTVKPEAVTRLNAMFLHAFRRDRRSRDPARLPHAAISYFRRLQLHSTWSIGASVPASSHPPPESASRGMMMAWNSFMTCMAAQRGFPAEKLLRMIDAVSKAGGPTTPSFRLQVPTITACIHGLVQRGEYYAAVQVWRRFLAKDIDAAGPLDWAALAAGGRALSESGHLAEAFELLNEAFLRNRVTSRGLETSTVEREARVHDKDDISSPFATSANSLITITAAEEGRGVLRFLTLFMRTLAHRGRPDIVYVLWDSMEQLYGVRPNNYTLNTLLVTASSFSAPSKAVSLSQQIGWRRRTSRRGEQGSQSSNRITEILNALRDPVRSAKGVGFWWRDRPAWQTAREIFREVILGNWPELALLPPPAVAHPEGFHPLIDFPRLRIFPPRPSSLSNSLTSQLPASSARATSLARIPRVTVGKYYDIIPTQRSFDAYIRLLCEHGLEAEIPEALLWQRELGILPSHRSLRMALLHFSAVGTSAPFDEAVLLKHGGADSPYGKLKTWISDWVPKGYMPTENEIGKERMLWGTDKDHWARQQLVRCMDSRRALWRRSRKDLRKKGPGKFWKEQTSAALARKHLADSTVSHNTLHNARVSAW